MRRFVHVLSWSFYLLLACAATRPSEQGTQAPRAKEGPMSEGTFAGLSMRSIGPAFMSGRIADVALEPGDPNVWYVGVGSGGVWKTDNAGTTWTSIFDGQGSYSIGCVTVDPSNPHRVWVGTGENVGGRHVAYGDGVYRSDDGGKTWKNLGLKTSEHISKILVHPKDSNTVWVAAQGPLWSSGGERGLYKTTDGGKTWTQVLEAGSWTGVTDLVMDPRDPDVLYAATWQRHRTVAGYVGGGPKSGIHKSEDGGETWTRLTTGLPGDPKRKDGKDSKTSPRPRAKPIDDGNMGKIGLAISPQNPDVLYAAIELNLRKGAVFRSTDRGASWEKRSDTVAGGTGPHYYQELYASPHAEGRIYLADVRMRVSDDGGKTFRIMSEDFKHSDNHSLTFRNDDPDYLLVGTDGGLYESFDLAKNWRFVDNLRSRSSTRSPSTTPRRSTTCTAALRTTTPRAGLRGPTARTAFATPTGKSCSVATDTSLRPSQATPTSCTPSPSRGTCTESTRPRASACSSSPKRRPATRPIVSTGTRRFS